MLLDGHSAHIASRLLLASQDLTYGNGFHNANGGSDRAINISEDMCFTMRRDLKVVQTRFIRSVYSSPLSLGGKVSQLGGLGR